MKLSQSRHYPITEENRDLSINLFWNGCRKINLTKVITTANQKKGNTWRANENSKYREVNYLKRGNTHLIGWESFASFLNQSQGEVKQN